MHSFVGCNQRSISYHKHREKKVLSLEDDIQDEEDWTPETAVGTPEEPCWRSLAAHFWQLPKQEEGKKHQENLYTKKEQIALNGRFAFSTLTIVN